MSMQSTIDFILALDRLKGVTRKTKTLHEDRYENSAEHSWQIAMLAASLAPYAVAPVDMDRVVGMLLVHDIGEIETGDTMVYVEEGLAERKALERAAVTRLFGMLPAEVGGRFMALWEEFEDGVTAEAVFAHAADRAMPVLLNLANAGQSWVENGIRHEQVVGKVGPPIRAGCPALWAHIEILLDDAREKGWFGQ